MKHAVHRIRARRSRQRGVTLIELMTVVAVVAILAGVAVPAYQDYLVRGKLSAGTALLREAHQRLENRYGDERSYGDALGGCAIGNFLDSDSQFSYTCILAGGGQGYVFTATGTAGTNGFIFKINEAGVESTTAVPTGWSSATLPVNRFILRKE